MSKNLNTNKTCVIIGASHAGVNLAFYLRNEGWEGKIILIDSDPTLPYHKPPLSKAYLTSDDGIEKNLLKSAENYEVENINLQLNVRVLSIDRANKNITLNNGSTQNYDKLVLATGARPIIPPIQGIKDSNNLFPLRTAKDVNDIRTAFNTSKTKRVVIIGGGYIGLETAASLKKLGGQVVVLEREDRILKRVTAPEMSTFFTELHSKNDVSILTNKNVASIETNNQSNTVICADGSKFEADIIIVGVGIHVNLELALEAGLDIENGIKINHATQTSDENIYAIGDCTFHYNPHYKRNIRLESVQNALDQAKIAAASISGKEAVYNSVPWFWSDQYNVKLQMVGLSTGYNQVLTRTETDTENKLSFWYFKDDELLAVDAVNNAKAYVYGTKFIKSGEKIDKDKLVDISVVFKPVNLLA